MHCVTDRLGNGTLDFLLDLIMQPKHYLLYDGLLAKPSALWWMHSMQDLFYREGSKSTGS